MTPQVSATLAVVGHGGCGKTQLVSAMLFAAGAVNRLGRVDDGSTVTDFDEEAIARKHTLAAGLAHAEWQKTKINIIDTPGVANFLTDARAALRVVEGALVVVDAVAGVEVQTEKLWSEATALKLPRVVVANRLDRDRASVERTLESLRRDCAREIVPIQLPIGEEKGWTGVVDLVRMKAFTFAADSSGKVTEADVPAALADRAEQAREQLIEMVAEADESLMEIYFAEGTLTQEQLVSGPAGRHRRGPFVSAGLLVGSARGRDSAAARRPRELRACADRARLPCRVEGWH